MHTPNLNKLSIQSLADAFTAEESPPKFGKVFAIYGQKATLDMLADFLKAIRPDEPRGQLWYRPFIVSPQVPDSSVFLGCMEISRDVSPEDFTKAIEVGMTTQEPTDPEPTQGCRPVWGTLLRLS